MSEPATTPAPTRPKRRSWGKLGCAGLLLLAVCLLLAPRLVPTTWIRRLIVKEVKRRTGRNCTLGGISIGWLDGVTLREFRIAGAAGEPPLIKARRLGLAVDLVALLQRRLVVESVLVEGARIDLRAAPPGHGSSPPAPLVIGKSTRVTDTTIRYRDPVAGMDTTWRVRELTIIGDDINKPMQVQGSISPRAGEKSLGRVTLSGKVDLISGDRPDPEGTASILLRLKDLAVARVLAGLGVMAAQVPPGASVSGPLRFEIKSKQVTLASEGLAINGLAIARAPPRPPLVLPPVQCAFALSTTTALHGITLGQARLGSPGLGAKLELRGKVLTIDTAPRAELQARLTCRAAPLAAFLRAGKLLAGIAPGVAGKLQAAGPVHVGPGGVRARLAIKPLQLSHHLPQPSATGQPARISLARGGALALQLDAQGLDLRFDAAGASAMLPLRQCKRPLGLEDIAASIELRRSPTGFSLSVRSLQASVHLPDSPWSRSAVIVLRANAAWQQDDRGRHDFRARGTATADFLLKPLVLSLRLQPGRDKDFSLTANARAEQLDLARLSKRLKIGPFGQGAYLQGKALALAGLRVQGGKARWNVSLSSDELWAYRPLAGCEEVCFGITAVKATMERDLDTGTLALTQADISTMPISASLRGTLAPGRGDIGFGLRAQPLSAPDFFAALGLPARLLDQVRLRGLLHWDPAALTLRQSEVKGKLRLDEAMDLSLTGDVDCVMRAGALQSLASRQLLLRLSPAGGGGGKSPPAPNLSVALGMLQAKGPWRDPSASMQVLVAGEPGVALQILQRLRRSYPSLADLSRQLTPYALAGRISLPGAMRLQSGRLLAEFANVRLQQPRLARRQVADGKPRSTTIFIAHALQAACKLDYDLHHGGLALDGLVLSVPPRKGEKLPRLRLTGRLGLTPPPTGNAKAAEPLPAKANLLLQVNGMDRLRRMFPGLLPAGASLRGERLTCALRLQGPTASRKLVADIEVRGGELRSAPAARPLLLPATHLQVSARLGLTRAGGRKPAPAAPFALLRRIDATALRLTVDRLAWGGTPFADLLIEGQLLNGVLTLRHLGLNACGRLRGAATVDFNRSLPACALALRTGKEGIDLARLFADFSGYGNIKRGILHLPAPEAEQPLQIAWSGLTAGQILATLSASPRPMLVNDFTLEINLDRRTLAGMTGIPLFMQLQGNVLAAVLKPFGAKLDRKTQRGVTSYSYASISGPLQILADGTQVAGKAGSNQATVYLPRLDIIGRDTADYRARGYYLLAGDFLNLRVHVIGHVERLVRAQDFEKVFSRASRLFGRKVSKRERLRLRASINAELVRLQNKRKLYFDIRGPLASAKMDSGKLQDLIVKAVGKVLRKFMLTSGRERLLEGILGRKKQKQQGSGQKDSQGTTGKKENPVDEFLRNLPF